MYDVCVICLTLVIRLAIGWSGIKHSFVSKIGKVKHMKIYAMKLGVQSSCLVNLRFLQLFFFAVVFLFYN